MTTATLERREAVARVKARLVEIREADADARSRKAPFSPDDIEAVLAALDALPTQPTEQARNALAYELVREIGRFTHDQDDDADHMDDSDVEHDRLQRLIAKSRNIMAMPLRAILSDALNGSATPQPTDEAVRGLVERLCVGAYVLSSEENAALQEEAAALIRSQSAEIDEYRQRENEVSAAIGTTAYLDPPDGGDVSLAEQVRRMSAEIARLQALPLEGLVDGECGWLIEIPSKPRPLWYAPVDHWLMDSSKALRFARREDAEAFLEGHVCHAGAFVSEHMWGGL